MRKLLIVFALLAYAPLLWQPLRGDSPGVGVSHPDNRQKRTKDDAPKADPGQVGAKSTPLVVDTEGHIQTAQEAADAKKKAERASEVERRTLDAAESNARYAWWTAVATCILVAIGGVAAFFANKTLVAIKDQVNLMAVPYRQSVMFTNWESEVYQAPPEQTPALRIGFSLVGAIPFPLTIHYGEIIFMPRTNPTQYVIQEVFLPPNTPHAGDVCFSLNDHTRLILKHGPVVFSFVGHFVHTGPLGERIKQQFAGGVSCREGHETTCEFRLHASQKDRDDQARTGQRPN